VQITRTYETQALLFQNLIKGVNSYYECGILIRQ